MKRRLEQLLHYNGIALVAALLLIACVMPATGFGYGGLARLPFPTESPAVPGAAERFFQAVESGNPSGCANDASRRWNGQLDAHNTIKQGSEALNRRRAAKNTSNSLG